VRRPHAQPADARAPDRPGRRRASANGASAVTPAWASARRLWPWLVATVVAACIVTAVDSYLLERSKGFFTGGFLADEHLRTWPQRLAFLGLSWLSDAAVVGFVAALAYGAFRRLGLGALTWPLAAIAG